MPTCSRSIKPQRAAIFIVVKSILSLSVLVEHYRMIPVHVSPYVYLLALTRNGLHSFVVPNVMYFILTKLTRLKYSCIKAYINTFVALKGDDIVWPLLSLISHLVFLFNAN